MSLLPEGMAAYIEAHTTPEDEVRYELNRTTNMKVSKPQMLSGHVQGEVLRFLSLMYRPKRVLEIGTYTGYATLCLAAGLPKDGLIHTIDKNDALSPYMHYYWEKAGLQEWIQWHNGDATTIIPELNEHFDLVFIDADKINYSRYYDLVFDKVPLHGIMIADNVLYGGQVLEQQPSQSALGIQQFNDKVQADQRVENTILSVRDGLMLIRKVST
jgi:predicted O-methyltransferase YrrM